MPTSPDFFGISDRVKQLSPPPGFEAVHTDGMSWARQGTGWADTTRISPADWNNLIGNLRGIGLMPETVDNTFDPAGPYVLREALVSFAIKQVDIMMVPYMASINAALALKAPLASPALTGTPTAPTPSSADSSTKLATTAYVKGLISDLYGGTVSNDMDTFADIEAKVATKAPLASPALTGTPTAPTPSSADSSTKLATTAFVKGLISDLYGGTVSNDMDTFADIEAKVATKAPLASPSLTGTPTAPTPSSADSSTKLATTAFVKGLITDLYGGTVSSDMDTFADIEAKVATKANLSLFEAGDWTPTFEGTTTLGSISYNSQVGKYVAIGRMVLVTFDVQAGAFFTTTPAGNLLIGGLPFAPDEGSVALGGGGIGNVGTIINLPSNFGGWAVKRASGSRLGLVYINSSTGAMPSANANILTENTRFSGSFVYRRA